MHSKYSSQDNFESIRNNDDDRVYFSNKNERLYKKEKVIPLNAPISCTLKMFMCTCV